MSVATTSKGGKSPLAPNELRDRDVEVGVHVGPPHELVPDLLAHFQRRYESAGRAILGLTVDAGLLASDSPKASVRLALPSKVLDSYFPQLFPLT
jgi:hypothetical protein